MRWNKFFNTTLFSIFLSALPSIGQSIQSQDDLTNNSIIELHELGMSDDVIVAKIKASRNKFDTSIDALKKLKDSGITQRVIAAMLETQQQNAIPTNGVSLSLK